MPLDLGTGVGEAPPGIDSATVGRGQIVEGENRVLPIAQIVDEGGIRREGVRDAPQQRLGGDPIILRKDGPQLGGKAGPIGFGHDIQQVGDQPRARTLETGAGKRLRDRARGTGMRFSTTSGNLPRR